MATPLDDDGGPPPCPPDHGPSPAFGMLVEELFDPLVRLSTAGKNRREVEYAGRIRGKQDLKFDLVRNLIVRWRADVGMDLYPVFRLGKHSA